MKQKQLRNEVSGKIPTGYRELKSVEGKVVGYICIECGRLNTAAHKPECRSASHEGA